MAVTVFEQHRDRIALMGDVGLELLSLAPRSPAMIRG